MAANTFRKDDTYLTHIAAAAAQLAEHTNDLYQLCNDGRESLDLLATLAEIKSFFGDLAKADQVTPRLELEE